METEGGSLPTIATIESESESGSASEASSSTMIMMVPSFSAQRRRIVSDDSNGSSSHNNMFLQKNDHRAFSKHQNQIQISSSLESDRIILSSDTGHHEGQSATTATTTNPATTFYNSTTDTFNEETLILLDQVSKITITSSKPSSSQSASTSTFGSALQVPHKNQYQWNNSDAAVEFAEEKKEMTPVPNTPNRQKNSTVHFQHPVMSSSSMISPLRAETIAKNGKSHYHLDHNNFTRSGRDHGSTTTSPSLKTTTPIRPTRLEWATDKPKICNAHLPKRRKRAIGSLSSSLRLPRAASSCTSTDVSSSSSPTETLPLLPLEDDLDDFVPKEELEEEERDEGEEEEENKRYKRFRHTYDQRLRVQGHPTGVASSLHTASPVSTKTTSSIFRDSIITNISASVLDVPNHRAYRRREQQRRHLRKLKIRSRRYYGRRQRGVTAAEGEGEAGSFVLPLLSPLPPAVVRYQMNDGCTNTYGCMSEAIVTMAASTRLIKNQEEKHQEQSQERDGAAGDFSSDSIVALASLTLGDALFSSTVAINKSTPAPPAEKEISDTGDVHSPI